jgi:hypothetical protein
VIDSLVTFKWQPRRAYRSKFTAHHVNTLRQSFARHYPKPHRFICVTDDPVGIEPGIEIVPLWDDFSKLRNPTWPTGPNCYRRLPVFGKKFAEIAGNRFMCMDLDVVITGDMTDIVDRTEDFVIWGTTNPRIPYCASMFLMTAGVHEEVLTDFDPLRSPRIASNAGYRGSDQGWINYKLGKDIPVWNRSHGVFSYKDHVLDNFRGLLPSNARIVIFHGKPDPWDNTANAMSPWIKKHYVCQP